MGKGGGGQEGGRPQARGGGGKEGTAAGRGPDPGGGRTVAPFRDGDREDPSSRPESSVSLPAPAVGGTRARLCREPRTSSLLAPLRRGSGPCGKGLGLPRPPFLLSWAPRSNPSVRTAGERQLKSQPFSSHGPDGAASTGHRLAGQGAGPSLPEQRLKCLKRVYSVLTVSEIKKKQ